MPAYLTFIRQHWKSALNFLGQAVLWTNLVVGILGDGTGSWAFFKSKPDQPTLKVTAETSHVYRLPQDVLGLIDDELKRLGQEPDKQKNYARASTLSHFTAFPGMIHLTIENTSDYPINNVSLVWDSGGMPYEIKRSDGRTETGTTINGRHVLGPLAGREPVEFFLWTDYYPNKKEVTWDGGHAAIEEPKPVVAAERPHWGWWQISILALACGWTGATIRHYWPRLYRKPAVASKRDLPDMSFAHFFRPAQPGTSSPQNE